MSLQFALTADQQSLLDHADRFSCEQLLPLAEKMDKEEWWPHDIFPKLGELWTHEKPEYFNET